MTTIEKLNKSKVPVIVFDKKLERFRDKILFPEKLARANDILSKVGLPAKQKKWKSWSARYQIKTENI